MVPYLGDFAEDATVYLMFNTFTSDDPSASCTITNLINTDVHIHKDDGLTQRNNAAGITVSVDFDGITGSHMIKIDTSDDTVAGFWVTGKDYFVRIEGTTVDGATLNVVVGHFSILNRAASIDLANATDGLGALKTLIDTVNTDLSNATDGLGALKTLIDANKTELDGLQGTDGKCLISTDAQDLSGSLDVNMKTITAGIIANASFNADVGSTAHDSNIIALACRKILEELNLDHLLKVTTGVAADGDLEAFCVAGTVMAHMLATGADATAFKASTDSLQGIRDHIGDGTNLTEAGGDGDHLTEVVLSAAANTAVIDEFETQSNADPTGFKVNVMEVNGTAQTANDMSGDINDILTDTAEIGSAVGASISADIAAIKAETALIVADTNELQTDDIPGKIDALPTAAEIKTAMEADGGDLSSLMEALVNKAIWTEANGQLEMHNDAGVSQGTIAAQISTDGTFTIRKRAFI